MSPSEFRYLALGDSYTIGESLPQQDSWPFQLVDRLRLRGLPMADPQIVARTAWTKDELLAGLAGTRPRGTFELVSVQIGVNNQYRGRDAEEYRHQFRDLLERATKYALGEGGRVLVLSIPDWGVTPFANDRDGDLVASDGLHPSARLYAVRADLALPLAFEALGGPPGV